MKISKRLLNALLIILLLLALLFAFGYVNSLVSYKYEVEDFLINGPNPTKNLDAHQKQIIQDIADCKSESAIAAIVFILILIARIVKPKFKGQLTYTR